MSMSKQIISIICGNRDKCKYVCVSIDILDHLLRIMAGELSAMGYPRWTPWCRSSPCMSVPWPCPWVAPDPVSVGGCRPPPGPRVRGWLPPCVWRLLALSAAGAPPVRQQGLSGGGESAAKRDRGRLSPWAAPRSVGSEGERLCLFGGGMKRGGLGGPGEVMMSFGAPVSPGEALPWQRGR